MVRALFLTNSQNFNLSKITRYNDTFNSSAMSIPFNQKNFQSATMHIAGTLRNINEERTVHVS